MCCKEWIGSVSHIKLITNSLIDLTTYFCFSNIGMDFSGSFFFCSTFLLGTLLGSSVNTRLHL